MMLKKGLIHTSRLTVTEAQTAQVIGSGDLPVLITPTMLALMKNATMLTMTNESEEGQTTVDEHVSSSHLKLGEVEAIVETTATLTKVDRHRLLFHVVARQDDEVIGEGSRLRFVVDKQYFMQR